MFKNFKIILFLVLLIEIALFIMIGELIGVFFTLLFVVLSMIVGFILLKKLSAKTMQQMQAMMQKGQLPSIDFFHHSMLTIASILLIVPGFFTDLIAILLFIPKTRPIISKLFSKINPTRKKQTKQKEDIIEGEYWKNNDDNSKHLE